MSLVCELCGSSEFIKESGMFICQSCGCKYSLEEARALMNDTAIGSLATVNTRNSSVENMFENAVNTFNAGSYADAYNLFNNVLNVQSDHALAMFYKGLSAGWQSTVAKCRFREAADYAVNAINTQHAKGEDIVFYAFCQTVLVKFGELAMAILVMYANHAKQKSDSALSLYQSQQASLKRQLADWNYIYSYGFSTGGSLSLKNMQRDAVRIQTELESESTTIQRDLDYKLADCSDIIIRVASAMNAYIFTATKENKELCETIKTYLKCCKLKSEFSEFKKIRGKKDNIIRNCDNIINEYKIQVTEYELQVAKEKERELQAQREQYLNEHPEEKQKLEEEKRALNQLNVNMDSLNEKRTQLMKRRDDYKLPNKQDIEHIESEIRRCLVLQETLGIFKGKEKKSLQNKIDSLNVTLDEEKRKYEDENKLCKEKRDTINNELAMINTERSSIEQKIHEINNRILEIENKFLLEE